MNYFSYFCNTNYSNDKPSYMTIAIIGAGAAGCFSAINIKRRHPDADIHIYESGTKALAKVAITGGGRCNLTNTFHDVTSLKDVYPRGDKLMKRVLTAFSNDDTCHWFESEGVRLVVQDDQCIFPQSQDAMEIVNTLLHLIHTLGIKLHLRHRVSLIQHNDDASYTIRANDTSHGPFSHVIVTTGGHPKLSGFDMLAPLELKIEPPVPSLFTFNVAGSWHQELMGTVVEHATVSITGSKLRSHGPLLFTHWGMSGPAILKLSSHAARFLADNDYRCNIAINWYGDQNEEYVRQEIASMMRSDSQKLITNVYPRHLNAKLWSHIIRRAGIPDTQRWGALNAKHINRLANTLTADIYEVTGKCPFKDEFVTCGGVSLKEININTMEAKKHPGLYLAGEVLDVDAVTGGFNLQAAWSMAMAIAEALK